MTRMANYFALIPSWLTPDEYHALSLRWGAGYWALMPRHWKALADA